MSLKEPDTPLKELAEWGLRQWQEREHSRETCSACGVRFDWDSAVGPAHSDDYHLFTQLCVDCYHDDAANYATAWKIKGWGYRNSPETELNDSGRPISQ